MFYENYKFHTVHSPNEHLRSDSRRSKFPRVPQHGMPKSSQLINPDDNLKSVAVYASNTQ